MPFQTDSLAVTIGPSGLYRLTAPLVYNGRDQTFTVPAGFLTDLASVPRYLTALVPIAGKWDRAAVVHDWLCVQLRHKAVTANPVDVDGIFRRMLRELGVPVVLRWLFWTGVRWGAAANPARSAGWWRTAPAVLGISVAALPVMLPVAVVTGLALAVGALAEGVAKLVTAA